MIRQTLEETMMELSLGGCATTVEETWHDLDRLAAVLDLRCAAASRQGFSEGALELVKGQLRQLARNLEQTERALYAHARLADD